MTAGVFLRTRPLGPAVPPVPGGEDAARPPHPDPVAVRGPDPFRAIGAHYRRLVPAENDRLRLRAAILAPRMSIAAMVRRDFETGRTVLVNGWVLAATEARQCALFSLLA